MIASHDPAELTAELERALASGDLAIDPLDAQAYGLDLEHLSADDFTLQTQLQTRIHAPMKTRMLHPRLIVHEHAQEVAAALGPMTEPGQRAHLVVSGNFIFGDLIEAWIVANDWLVPDLHVATLSLSQDNIDSLANLLHGDYVRRLHLYVSDYWFAHERRDLVLYAYRELDLGGDTFQLTVTASHAKVTLIGTDQGAQLVLHGSANLRSSASIEQLAIEHDPDLYAFHLGWLQALEAQYHTIHPAQPGPAAPKRQQWQTVAHTAPATTGDPAQPSRVRQKAPPRDNAAPSKRGAAPHPAEA